MLVLCIWRRVGRVVANLVALNVAHGTFGIVKNLQGSIFV